MARSTTAHCARCQAANRPLYTPTLLRGEWILVPAATGARHPVCEECGTVVVLTGGTS